MGIGFYIMDTPTATFASIFTAVAGLVTIVTLTAGEPDLLDSWQESVRAESLSKMNESQLAFWKEEQEASRTERREAREATAQSTILNKLPSHSSLDEGETYTLTIGGKTYTVSKSMPAQP
jgi:hypothetical protein